MEAITQLQKTDLLPVPFLVWRRKRIMEEVKCMCRCLCANKETTWEVMWVEDLRQHFAEVSC